MQSATALLSGNLPDEPNSFIGRERDLAELARLLSEVRALTLSGPGGIGKTRLAVRLAREVISDFDEAWLVELADWHGDTADRVAATIGVREEQASGVGQGYGFRAAGPLDQPVADHALQRGDLLTDC